MESIVGIALLALVGYLAIGLQSHGVALLVFFGGIGLLLWIRDAEFQKKKNTKE